MMQLNISGAATQPCPTSLEMVNQSERVLLVRTQLDGSVYSRSSTRTILGGMPMKWIMCHRQSLSTESNEAFISMKAMKSARSFRNSRAFSASNRMAEMLSVVDRPGIKMKQKTKMTHMYCPLV